MKKLCMFFTVLLPVLFLLNSFVPKDKQAGEKTTNVPKLVTGATPNCKPATDSSRTPVSNVNNTKTGFVNSVFTSADGGQTWQDISNGLPETGQPVGFFAGVSELYLHVKNGLYRSKGNLKTPVWEKESVPDLQPEAFWPGTSIAFNRSGAVAFNYNGQIYQKTPTAANWLPVLTNFKKHALRTVFESADGTVFLGYDHGLYKSADKGKNWKQVQEGMIMNIVESEGVLVATGAKGIMRSTDNGEHWQWVISEGGVGIAIERINGGFAAISYNTKTESRKIHISLDQGKTWQAIDEGLRPSQFITSIKQMGNYLLCAHPDGIFQSADMGKTWKRVYPGIDPGVFTLYVSGTTLYAVAGNAGC